MAEVNNQRIVQAVRRIAATVLQEDSPLDAAKPKARIGKTRGAAYYNSNGDIDSGDEVPAEAVDPEKDVDSTTKKRDYQLISDDHQEGDTVDEIEAFDCATGQKIQLDLAPEEGIEFVPPPGWDDPDKPPVDPTYEIGYFWIATSADSSRHATLNQVKDHTYQYALGQEQDDVPGVVNFTFEYEFIVVSSSHAQWYVTKYDSRSPAYTDYSTYHVYRYACGGSPDSYCNPAPEDILVESAWPSDNITTLILKDRKFTANQFDPDAADAYKNTPPSSIEVCDGQGNRFSVSALENGRSMITKLNPDGTVPESGHSLIIDRNGKVANKIGNKVRDGYL